MLAHIALLTNTTQSLKLMINIDLATNSAYWLTAASLGPTVYVWVPIVSILGLLIFVKGPVLNHIPNLVFSPFRHQFFSLIGRYSLSRYRLYLFYLRLYVCDKPAIRSEGPLLYLFVGWFVFFFLFSIDSTPQDWARRPLTAGPIIITWRQRLTTSWVLVTTAGVHFNRTGNLARCTFKPALPSRPPRLDVLKASQIPLSEQIPIREIVAFTLGFYKTKSIATCLKLTKITLVRELKKLLNWNDRTAGEALLVVHVCKTEKQLLIHGTAIPDQINQNFLTNLILFMKRLPQSVPWNGQNVYLWACSILIRFLSYVEVHQRKDILPMEQLGTGTVPSSKIK